MPDDLDLRDLDQRHEPDPAFRAELRRQVQAVVGGDASASVPTTTTAPREEDLIMLTDTRTDPSPSPTKPRWLLPAAAAAVVAMVVAGVALTQGGDDDGEQDAAANSSVVFEDDFSDDSGRWEPMLDSIRIEDGHQVWNVTPPGQTDFFRPAVSEPRLADTEVSATVASVDPDSTVGLYCRKGVANQDAYYFFRLAPEGAVIGVLPPDPGPAVTLAEDASFIRPSAPFEITARCVDDAGVATLTLLVDGEVVLEATHDDPLRDGYGALEVTAGARGSTESEVRWDEFSITAL